MKIPVDPKWSFIEALVAAWNAYPGGIQFGVPNRNRILEQWANVVGRQSALKQLQEAIGEHESLDQALEAFGMSKYSYTKLKKSFGQMPELEPNIGSEGLSTVLNKIPSMGNLTELHLCIHLSPLIAEFLGYDLTQLHYQYPIFKNGHHGYFDAVLTEPSTNAPEIILEFLISRTEQHIPSSVMQKIREYQGIVDCKKAIVISNKTFSILVGESLISFPLGKVTKNDENQIKELLATSERNSTSRHSRQMSMQENMMAEMLSHISLAVTNEEKKKSLESFAKVVFSCHGDISVKSTNLRTRSSEIDIVCQYIGGSSNEFLKEYGCYFLVECKNWSKPAGAKEVRDFIGKLNKTKTKLGILFSKSGITGEANGGDALREIQASFDNNGPIVVTISLEELRGFEEIHEILRLVEEKLFALRFDL